MSNITSSSSRRHLSKDEPYNSKKIVKHCTAKICSAECRSIIRVPKFATEIYFRGARCENVKCNKYLHYGCSYYGLVQDTSCGYCGELVDEKDERPIFCDKKCAKRTIGGYERWWSLGCHEECFDEQVGCGRNNEEVDGKK